MYKEKTCGTNKTAEKKLAYKIGYFVITNMKIGDNIDANLQTANQLSTNAI